MNQARISNLVSKLNYKVLPKPRRLKNTNGPEGRILKLQKTLTALLKYERIELNYNRADEARGYMEQLISQVLRYGPEHKKTIQLADFWIIEKQIIHKLLNVMIPRYQKYNTLYTNLYISPREYPGMYRKRSILELKGNPFPHVLTHSSDKRLLLQNDLLNEAKKQYRIQQYAEIVKNIAL